jgi:hypothetical protein
MEPAARHRLPALPREPVEHEAPGQRTERRHGRVVEPAVPCAG